MHLANALRFVVPVAVGVAVLVLVVRSADPPARTPTAERATPVRTIVAPELAVVPRVRAYGTVRPKRAWDAVAEVGGRVVEMHPQLREGAFMRAGTLLLRIDPRDFELAIAQSSADIEAARAQLAEVAVREANARASLDIEEDSLALSRAELERVSRLSKRGAVARSDLDVQERAVLSQRQAVTTLENTLRLIPSERRLLQAQIARHDAQLDVARRDLERTRFVLPFDARIAVVEIEQDQSVRVGDVPVVAHDISVAEVLVDLDLQRVRQVMRTRSRPLESLPEGDVGELLGVSATVRLTEFDLEWPARFARLSANLDPRTRTIGAIVEVDEPYRGVIPGVRPPLVKDMFVQVEFRGAPREGAVVVPRTAVRQGRVNVVGADERLEIREVEIAIVLPEAVQIATGVAAGERVVVSEIAAPVAGMRLAPVADEDALRRLEDEARGEGPAERAGAGADAS